MYSLFRWCWRRPPLGDVPVVLYTRRGCHLCEGAWESLQEARRRYQFPLAVVDVDSDPVLAAQHGNWVPVVTVDGKVRFRGAVNRLLLIRLLEAERRERSPKGAKGRTEDRKEC